MPVDAEIKDVTCHSFPENVWIYSSFSMTYCSEPLDYMYLCMLFTYCFRLDTQKILRSGIVGF